VTEETAHRPLAHLGGKSAAKPPQKALRTPGSKAKKQIHCPEGLLKSNSPEGEEAATPVGVAFNYIHIGSLTLAERPKRELKQTLARHHVAVHSSPNPGQLPGTRLAHGGIAAVLMTHPQHNSCWQRVSTNRAYSCTPLRMLSGFTAAFALRFASCVCKLRHS